MTTLFRLLFRADLCIAAVLGLIFSVGLVDTISRGQVDREDLLLWPPLMAGIGIILAGGRWLWLHGHRRAATFVLLLMAVPGLIAGLLLFYLLEELMRPGAWH